MPLTDKFMDIYRTCCSDSKTRLKVKTVGPNKCLDVTADRLEAQDWQPLLKALRRDSGLHTVSIRSFLTDKRKCRIDQVKPAIHKQSIVDELIDSITQCMKRSDILTTIQLQAVPLAKRHVDKLGEAIKECKTLQNLVLTHFGLKDEGLLTLYDSVHQHLALSTVDFTGCGLTCQGARTVAKIIKVQRMTRFDETWKHSLRYREPDQDLFPGIRRITLNDNPHIGDEGCLAIFHELMDDLWIKAVDMQNCGLGEASGKEALSLIKVNETIKILDVRGNDRINLQTKKIIKDILSVRSNDETKSKMGKERDSRIFPHYNWLEGSSVRTKNSTSRKPNSECSPKSWELSQITECSKDVANSYPSSSQTIELRHTKKELSDTKRDLHKEREKREELERQKAKEKIKLAEKFNKEWNKRKRLERERDMLKEELHVYTSEGSTSKSKVVTTLSSLKTISKTKVKNNKKTPKKIKKGLEVGNNVTKNSAVPKAAKILKNGHTAHKNGTKVARTSSNSTEPVDTNELETDKPYDEVRNTQQLHLMQKNLDKLNFNAGNAMPMQPGSTTPSQSMTQFTPSQHMIQSSPSTTMTTRTFAQTENQSTASQPMIPWMSSQSTTQSALPQWFPMKTGSEIDSNVQNRNANMEVHYEDISSSERRNQGFEKRMPRDLNSVSRSQWIFGELMLGESTSRRNLNTDFRLRANAQ